MASRTLTSLTLVFRPMWLQLHQLTFGLLPSAIAASLPGVSLCGFKDIDQPHFGFSACVALAIAISLLEIRLCGSKRIGFTLVMSLCGFKYTSSTFSYHPLRHQACQLHSRLSACVASAVPSSLSGYQPWWLQKYIDQIHFGYQHHVCLQL